MSLKTQPVLPWSTHRVYSVRLQYNFALAQSAYRSSGRIRGTGISGYC